jgi:hypothetical protein
MKKKSITPSEDQKYKINTLNMIEIFMADIATQAGATKTLDKIKAENPELKINFDPKETDLPFPCGHTIFRIEGELLNSENISNTFRNLKVNTGILEDRICK